MTPFTTDDGIALVLGVTITSAVLMLCLMDGLWPVVVMLVMGGALAVSVPFIVDAMFAGGAAGAALTAIVAFLAAVPVLFSFFMPKQSRIEIDDGAQLATAPRCKIGGRCQYCGRDPCGCGASGEPA